MNDFEKLMKNPIVDRIWECEKEEYETYIIKLEKDKREFYIDEKLEEEIQKFLEKSLSLEKFEEYKYLYRKFCKAYTEEIEYWIKKYFSSGFFDGIRLYDELSCYMSEKQQKTDTFFNYNENCFTEYIVNAKFKKLLKNEEYRKLDNEIKNIKKKYPRVQDFLEEEIIEDITDEEQKAIIEIINLENSINNISDKIVYKLGMSENNWKMIL